VSCSRGYWCSDAHPMSRGCGRHFRSLEAFDAHRAGGGCLPSAVLVGRGWRLVDGFWLSPWDLRRRGQGSARDLYPRRDGRKRGARTDGRGPGTARPSGPAGA